MEARSGDWRCLYMRALLHLHLNEIICSLHPHLVEFIKELSTSNKMREET